MAESTELDRLTVEPAFTRGELERLRGGFSRDFDPDGFAVNLVECIEAAAADVWPDEPESEPEYVEPERTMRRDDGVLIPQRGVHLAALVGEPQRDDVPADWTAQAACRDWPTGPAGWCIERGDERRLRHLRSVCATCPVAAACLRSAHEEVAGVRALEAGTVRCGVTGRGWNLVADMIRQARPTTMPAWEALAGAVLDRMCARTADRRPRLAPGVRAAGSGRFGAYVAVAGTRVCLGTVDTEDEAAHLVAAGHVALAEPIPAGLPTILDPALIEAARETLSRSALAARLPVVDPEDPPRLGRRALALAHRAGVDPAPTGWTVTLVPLGRQVGGRAILGTWSTEHEAKLAAVAASRIAGLPVLPSDPTLDAIDPALVAYLRDLLAVAGLGRPARAAALRARLLAEPGPHLRLVSWTYGTRASVHPPWSRAGATA